LSQAQYYNNKIKKKTANFGYFSDS